MMPFVTMASAAYKVRNEDAPPPGGWRWRHPASGKLFADNDLARLERNAQRTLMNLGRDPAPVRDQIHAETAINLVAINRSDLVDVAPAPAKAKPVKRTAAQYRSGAKAAFLKWWRESPVYGLIRGKTERGEPVFVHQREGDRRAAICAGCPHNVMPAGKGWLHNWSDGQMIKSVEGRVTASHEDLGVCDVCSCELRAAVWWSPDIIVATTRDAKFARDFPTHCWKRQIIQPPL